MRFRGLIIVGLLALLAGQGCERRISGNELGNVVFDLPDVPGADKPPPTPELDALEQTQPPSSSKPAGPARSGEQGAGSKER